jgi:hypothetical protein
MITYFRLCKEFHRKPTWKHFVFFNKWKTNNILFKLYHPILMKISKKYSNQYVKYQDYLKKQRKEMKQFLKAFDIDDKTDFHDRRIKWNF